VRIEDPAVIQEGIKQPELEVLRFRHYQEYDHYFSFEDPKQGHLRYREDEFLDENGEVKGVRYRLTLLGPARERRFPNDVLLSRTRYMAPATHSLRFYREYFKPAEVTEITKDRQRWRVLYKGTEFFINLDQVQKPELGYFLEIKSRTWSRRDAEFKAQMTNELINYLGISPSGMVINDYIEIVETQV
jgi:5-methylthioadenosine/S-adenosylhomocysteine deaminase